MINLKSLIDLLPYYFKEQDTYKVDGKGLLERYLNIFGDYFDTKVIKNIDTLDDILNIDKTPEIYLGYLWEFLGSMPYANPKAIDPDKWKQYFNGFSDDSTIEALSKVWLYRKDSDNDHYNLTLDQIRSLVKYSIALFSIRGTKKFFEVFLRLYGFEVTISNGSTYPKITITDGDDSDYYGSDDDYYGIDQDYFGLPESIFDSKSEPTKLDSEELTLDDVTLDNHTGDNRIVNINFRLKSEYIYDKDSDEFLRLQDRMFNLINIFLPIGSRPHLIWDNISSNGEILNGFENKVNRSIEMYVDRAPLSYSDQQFTPSDKYPGWYQVHSLFAFGPTTFTWSPFKLMIRVVDEYPLNHIPAFIKDQPKRFNIAFGGDYSEIEYEDGKVFTINPGNALNPRVRVSTICEEDFNITNMISSFRVDTGDTGWKKYYNYTLFKHYNSNLERELNSNHKYIPIIIQSAIVRTLTNNADPSDDDFTPQQVINLTTGEYLTFIENDTKIPDKDGNEIDYSSYAGTNTYVQHIFKPGTYEFIMLSRPEYKLTIEVTSVPEVLETYLIDGLADNVIDNDNPTCNVSIGVRSNTHFLKNISTLPLYISSNSGKMWEKLVEGASSSSYGSPDKKMGNYHDVSNYFVKSLNLYYVDEDDMDNRRAPINFYLCFLSKPVHTNSQYIKFTFIQYPNDEHDSWYDKVEVTIYPLINKVLVVEEDYRELMDGTPQYTYKYGDDVILSDFSKVLDNFILGDIQEDTGIGSDHELISVPGVSVRTLTLPNGIYKLAPIGSMDHNELIIEYKGLYDDEVLIQEVSNPVSQFWNNGEIITLGDPGHYRFYGTNTKSKEAVSDYQDISVQSNKYNAHYYLEVHDGDKTDDENYMLRTLIKSIPKNGVNVQWGFDFSITLDKSILEAMDILTTDPDAFDFEVLLYKGSTPNMGQLINSYTGTHTVDDETDDIGNLLPHYKVSGHIDLMWDGSYIGSNNYPPGLYCVELHDRNHVWPGTSAYRVVDAYVVPQKFDGNLYFDVEVISKAWTSPSGQSFDIDPITGKRTWGWYKTNPDYLNSVRLVRYDPAIDIPRFKLKLTNNSIGYNRVYMYKLVDNGSEWNNDVNETNKHTYPEVLSPHKDNKHWLYEAQHEDWGFPGEFDEETQKWDYAKGSTGIPGYKGRWLFTGTVYQIGELITGPQEPGKYLFLVNQLGVDTKVINYAYMEVKEQIKYSLIVNPMLAILQGTAVGTTVDAISSAKFTKETLAVTVTQPDGTLVESQHSLPYAFYAYQAGTYTFNLYKLEEGHWVSLDISANFRVLTDNGIYPESLLWESQEVQDKAIQVATTSQEIEWSIRLQDE